MDLSEEIGVTSIAVTKLEQAVEDFDYCFKTAPVVLTLAPPVAG